MSVDHLNTIQIIIQNGSVGYFYQFDELFTIQQIIDFYFRTFKNIPSQLTKENTVVSFGKTELDPTKTLFDLRIPNNSILTFSSKNNYMNCNVIGSEQSILKIEEQLMSAIETIQTLELDNVHLIETSKQLTNEIKELRQLLESTKNENDQLKSKLNTLSESLEEEYTEISLQEQQYQTLLTSNASILPTTASSDLANDDFIIAPTNPYKNTKISDEGLHLAFENSLAISGRLVPSSFTVYYENISPLTIEFTRENNLRINLSLEESVTKCIDTAKTMSSSIWCYCYNQNPVSNASVTSWKSFPAVIYAVKRDGWIFCGIINVLPFMDSSKETYERCFVGKPGAPKIVLRYFYGENYSQTHQNIFNNSTARKIFVDDYIN